MNTRDNDHVELHDLLGFIAKDLSGTLREAEAIAMGTKCINHLFFLSLSPPEYAEVAVQTFENLTAAEFYSPVEGYIDSVTGDPNISDWLVTLKSQEI